MTQFHTIQRMIIPAVLVSCMAMAGCSPPKTSFTVTKATVMKVYSATDSSGHRFVSYVVDRGGVEIVVSDSLAKTTYKVGDTIQYLDQKIEISGTKTLNFMIVD